MHEFARAGNSVRRFVMLVQKIGWFGPWAGLALTLLALACHDDPERPFENQVHIVFSGTVTLMLHSGGFPPPGDVAIGSPVQGSLSYVPSHARALGSRPGSRNYLFPSSAEKRLTVSIGKTTWSLILGTIFVCNEVCDGDAVGCTAATGPSLVSLQFLDDTDPYTLVDGDDLPDSPDDIDATALQTGDGRISHGSQAGIYTIDFAIDSVSVETPGIAR